MSYYKAYAVDPSVYDSHPLDSEFKGGIVIDGLYDQELANHVLLVRLDEPDINWKQMYHILRSLIDRVYVANAVSKMALVQDIRNKDTMMAGSKAGCVRDLLAELGRAGAIQIGQEDHPTEIYLIADALVIRDRETFNTLPLIVDDEGDIDFTSEPNFQVTANDG